MRIAMVVVLAAGCSMYGPNERLHPLQPSKPPAEAADAIVYVDACPVDFERDASRVAIQRATAAKQRESGDAATAAANKATGPEQAKLVVSSIERYSDALRADPYNAGATLELAIAYDRMLRKGCALAMLRRLDSLTHNAKIAPDAPQRVADVIDNPQWFGGYRSAALAALGH